MILGSFMPRRSVWDQKLEGLGKSFPEHTILQGLGPDSEDLSRLDIILSVQLPREVFEKAKALKAIFQPLTGINHLPLELLSERGVHVYNNHANAFDVAERALAMALAFYGRIVEYHNDLAACRWHGLWVKGGAEDRWESLHGKTCAILGTGAIGQALARLLGPFSCRVIGWRRREGLPLPEGFQAVYASLDQALEEADVVFVALPGTAQTQGLLSRERLAKMGGKLLVNVGRGSIIDEEGLYLALKEGILRGAAIDTWYQYPQEGRIGAPSRFPIHELSNVLLSPHVGGSTHQASLRSVDRTVEKIEEYLKTGSCAEEADLRAAY